VRCRPRTQCVAVPMADGGKGTVDAVVDALGGQRVVVDVADVMDRSILAGWGYVPQ
jgi:glycerate 2-kinase